MSLTTIPVDSATRDRLRAFAMRSGDPGRRMTYDRAVNALLDLADRRRGHRTPEGG